MDDGIDQDCNGIDLSCDDPSNDSICDVDEDGYTADVDCNDNNPHAYSTEAAEICDSEDNNCDDVIDEGVKTTFYLDEDMDGYGNASLSSEFCILPYGYSENAEDCDDSDTTVFQWMVEIQIQNSVPVLLVIPF